MTLRECRSPASAPLPWDWGPFQSLFCIKGQRQNGGLDAFIQSDLHTLNTVALNNKTISFPNTITNTCTHTALLRLLQSTIGRFGVLLQLCFNTHTNYLVRVLQEICKIKVIPLCSEVENLMYWGIKWSFWYFILFTQHPDFICIFTRNKRKGLDPLNYTAQKYLRNTLKTHQIEV